MSGKKMKDGERNSLDGILNESAKVGENAELEFLERQGMPKSRFPELSNRLVSHWKEYGRVQSQIDELHAQQSQGERGYFGRLLLGAKQKLTPQEYHLTFDKLVRSQMQALRSMSSTAKTAARRIGEEANEEHKYWESAVARLKQTNMGFKKSETLYGQLEAKLEDLTSETREVTWRDSEGLNKYEQQVATKNEMARLTNWKYIYAARGLDLMVEVKQSDARQATMRDMQYELKYIEERTGLRLASAEQTYKSATTVQVAYQAVELMRLASEETTKLTAALGRIEAAATARFTKSAAAARSTQKRRESEYTQTQIDSSESAETERRNVIGDYKNALSLTISETMNGNSPMPNAGSAMDGPD